MNHSTFKAFCLSCFLILTCFSCQNSSERTAKNSSSKSEPSAIEMMADVFTGNHSEQEVNRKMDIVMTQYGYAISEKNYHKCGSALLELRKATGVPEMEIIDHMLLVNSHEYGVTFAEQAGLSATLLSKE